jgi:hypothetical protein
VWSRPAGRLTRKGRRSKAPPHFRGEPSVEAHKERAPGRRDTRAGRVHECRRRGVSGVSRPTATGRRIGSTRIGHEVPGADDPAPGSPRRTLFPVSDSARRGPPSCGPSVLRAHARDSVDSGALVRPHARSIELAARGVLHPSTTNAIRRSGHGPAGAVAWRGINPSLRAAFAAGGQERFSCRTEKW